MKQTCLELKAKSLRSNQPPLKLINLTAGNSGRLNYQKENRRKLTLGETGA